VWFFIFCVWGPVFVWFEIIGRLALILAKYFAFAPKGLELSLSPA
jgi:hypothetical protein